MKHIMNLKWCVFIGALMLASVGVTFLHQGLAQDPIGVHTRWWDGTRDKADVFYPDGQLASSTTYGDDGKTVLTLKEWSRRGALTREKTRREDGKVYEKLFSEDGKVLLQETLWVGDESYFVGQREYHDNGKLAMETIMTEDGRAPTLRRVLNSKGELLEEARILSNADHQVNEYKNSIVVRRQTFKANGDVVIEVFFEGTEIVSLRNTMIRLDGRVITENFDRSGKLIENKPSISVDSGKDNDKNSGKDKTGKEEKP
jgi:antitoxin component YwqK of YwqJK toxin-antitoxin module